MDDKGATAGDGVVAALAAALQGMVPERVPPPAVCSRVGQLPQFFKTFEKYARSLYKQDEEAWLQILPNYVEGEVLQIVKAFGDSVDYAALKGRILRDFVRDSKVTGESYAEILGLKMKEGESLRCFYIRLEALAERVESSASGKTALVMSALRNNLSKEVLLQVDLQLCARANVTIEEFINVSEAIARTITLGAVGTSEKVRATVQTQNDNVGPLRNNRYDPADVICYKCGIKGHSARYCPQNMSNSDRSRKSCFSCNEVGHFARDCPSKNKQTLKNKQNTPNDVNTFDRVTCGFCGSLGHPMMRCTDFIDFRKELGSASANIRGTRNDKNLN